MQKIPIKIKSGPTNRQKSILEDLIRNYFFEGGPVSSQKINKTSKLKVSPATIRIELANLEKQDLIYHPHTSAGCIPTDLGLRYFIDNFMDDTEIDLAEKEELTRNLVYLNNQYNNLIKEAVNVLSDNFSYTVLGVLPNKEVYYKGISNLIKDSSFSHDDLLKIFEIIDNFEEYIEPLLQEPGDYKIYIGQENPIKKMSSNSMVVAGYELKNWGNGIMAIIGPKKMPYHEVMPLLKYISSYISGREE